jgi:hypothetical protein
MSVTGFWVDRSNPGVSDLIRQIRMPNTVQFSEGDACYVSTADGTGGLIIQADSQTAPVAYVFLSMVADKSYLRPATFDEAVVNEYAELIEVSDGYSGFPIVLNTQFAAATFDGTATTSNSVANEIHFTGTSGSADDFTGGQVYVNELNQQFTIIDDDTSTTSHVYVVAPTPPVTISTGYTIRAVPWGPGYVGGVKLQATNPQQGISTALADKTGGPLYIYNVDLSKRIAYVRFQPFLIAK